MDIVKSIEHEQLKNKIPDLKVGNTVKVHQRIKEGNCCATRRSRGA